MVEHQDDVIVAVVSECFLVKEAKGWIVDSGATKHICAKKEMFSDFYPIEDGKDYVYLGDSSKVSVLGKGKVSLKMTSGKTLVLSEVLFVPAIKHCLVSVHLLNNANVKVTFDSNIVTLSKNEIYVGKGYLNDGLYVLNVVTNNNEGSSFAYLVDSLDVWHGRLGHVNVPYILKLKEMGLINKLDNSSLDKCEIYVETKITKKPSKQVTRQSELLELVHSDLGDLKHTMTRGGKRFYIIFVDDYSRYTKLYLLRTKDEACEMFIKYKNEVENQLGKKIKRLRTDRGGEYE